MKLSIKPNIKSTIYHCTSVNRTVLGAKKIEFVLDKVVELTFKEASNNQKIFTVNLLGHKLKGTSLIHEWASDIENLQSKLVFKTDCTGKILEIENTPELYVKWHKKFKDYMLEKYTKLGGKEGAELMVNRTESLLRDKKKLLNNFTGFNLYRIFFQGMYENELKLTDKEYVIKGHFGKHDLPLLLNTNLTQNKSDFDNYTILDTKGKLDKQKFNQEAFTKYIKSMIGVLDVNATLHTEMEEKYIIKKSGWINQADLYLKTHAANMYALANAHMVKQIDKISAEKYVTEFNKQ